MSTTHLLYLMVPADQDCLELHLLPSLLDLLCVCVCVCGGGGGGELLLHPTVTHCVAPLVLAWEAISGSVCRNSLKLNFVKTGLKSKFGVNP